MIAQSKFQNKNLKIKNRNSKSMKIATLFDGAGLARLGLEQAGHECVGVELDPFKHHLSKFVGSGNCILADATKFDLSDFDAVWASPPCQWHSSARTQGNPKSKYSGQGLLDWALKLQQPILWVENVLNQSGLLNLWGQKWNAAQFENKPRQNRNRIVGGRYKSPFVYHRYNRRFPGICPTVLATEYKGSASDTRRASRYFGRSLSLEECAYFQGFSIPKDWYLPPFQWSGTADQWRNNLFEAVGNGVPCYMAKGFGLAYKGA